MAITDVNKIVDPKISLGLSFCPRIIHPARREKTDSRLIIIDVETLSKFFWLKAIIVKAKPEPKIPENKTGLRTSLTLAQLKSSKSIIIIKEKIPANKNLTRENFIGSTFLLKWPAMTMCKAIKKQ